MLKIKGPAVQRKNYTRVPMTDGAGNVSAFVHDNYVNFRPLGGTEEQREARASVIAAEQGGWASWYTVRGLVVHIASVHFIAS